MEALALSIADGDALDEAIGRVLQSDLVRSKFGDALAIHTAPPPSTYSTDAERTSPVLYWQLTRMRARIGPLLGTERDGCARCLEYWLDHNRPDKEIWSRLPKAGGVPSATLPWPRLAFELLEQFSIEYLVHGEGRSFVDVTFLPPTVERHRYPASPDCPICTEQKHDAPNLARIDCGSIGKPGPSTFRSRAIAKLAPELRERFVDYRSGLIRHMYRDRTSVMLPMWAAETNVTNSTVTEAGYGRHANAQASEAIAILEALERFCGQAPRGRTGFRRGSFNGFRKEGVDVADPRSFILCPADQQEHAQYNLARYSPDRDYDWIWAYSFKRKGPVLIPLQFGFYHQGLFPAGERFVQESSNGCAMGGSLTEAVFHGLLEIIERDAYMTRWHVKGEPRRLALRDSGSRTIRDLYARTRADGFELHAFDISLEIPVPTVLAMIVDPAEDAAVKSYCASAAHPVAATAIYSALVEVVSSIAVYQNQFGKERDRARELYADHWAVTQMRDHVLLYSLPESLSRLSFLNRESKPARPDTLYGEMESRWTSASLDGELSDLIGHLWAIADDIIVVDQTADLIKSMDLHCVKVLAPGTHPVTFGHQYRRISEKRLTHARQYLREKGEIFAQGQNPHPHNFP